MTSYAPQIDSPPYLTEIIERVNQVDMGLTMYGLWQCIYDLYYFINSNLEWRLEIDDRGIMTIFHNLISEYQQEILFGEKVMWIIMYSQEDLSTIEQVLKSYFGEDSALRKDFPTLPPLNQLIDLGLYMYQCSVQD